MPFRTIDAMEYFYFELFEEYGLVQGIFTRKGGVSPAQWSSLNLGGTTGDSRANVIENRQRIFNAVHREVHSIFDVWQVHGTTAIATREPRELDGKHQPADIIFTNQASITLMMRFADCVPIFLFDPRTRAVGIVHAGWQGTVKHACRLAVEEMTRVYGSKAGDILAGIGPSIGVDHYQVGEDVATKVVAAFPDEHSELLIKRENKIYLDLWKANAATLKNAGVSKIEISGICTACDLNRWYSHRAEGGATGRFGAVLALP